MKETTVMFYYSTDNATYGMAIENADDLYRARKEVTERFMEQQRKYCKSLEELEHIRKLLGLEE